MTVIDTQDGINFFQLCQLRGCLKMEKMGMSHSRMGKLRKPVALMMGLKPSAKIEDVIAAVQAKIDEAHAANQPQPIAA